MKTKIIIAGVATMLMVAVAFKLKSNKQFVEENIYRPDTRKRVLVQAVPVVMKSLGNSYSYTGTFAAFREVMLVPQVHGEIKGVYFEEGQHLPLGKLLVQIDDDLLQAQYIAAETNYQIAGRNLERYRNASTGGGVSKVQLDNFQLALKTAESEVLQLKKRIALSKITAPFSGTVTFKNAEIGSAAGNEPVARITDLTLLKLEISVPEKEIIFFREGKQANIFTDIYPGKAIVGKVDYIAARADDAHNYVVKLLITNSSTTEPLKAGMYGTVTLDKNAAHEALLVPRIALLGSAKNPQVFVIENQKATLRSIETGNSNDEKVEVINGLEEGDVVVTTGQINLKDGSPVAVAKK